MNWLTSLLYSDRQLHVLAGLLVVVAVPLLLAALMAWRQEAKR